MFVRKASLEYLGSAVYDDVLDIGMRCARVGNSSMSFVCGAFRQDALLVSGELIYVFADPAAKVALPVPPELRALFEGFEAGESMVDVRVGSWRELEAAARPVRAEVFIGEQKIPAEMEWDDADADAVHAVAFNRLGRALGTGRMLEHVPGVAKIGRMAVAASSRHGGVGRTVLDALLDAARARGDREAVLHAQLGAAPFYERAGFVRRGPEFDEAGIAHVEMLRVL
jgi:predicted GNAT family N-acyltransferase